jgi:hypothetical protein
LKPYDIIMFVLDEPPNFVQVSIVDKYK